jgi:hypothetical protein
MLNGKRLQILDKKRPLCMRGAGIAQWVQRVATGWAAVGSQFESLQRQD